MLWSAGPTGVVARRSPPDSPPPARACGAATFSGRSTAGRSTRRRTSWQCCTPRRRGESLTYTIARDPDAASSSTLRLAPIPSGARGLYYVLAAVGIFTLLVGAGVRLRRPDDQATLHFFWLSVAFFGVLAFSFSGRLDRLDWVFYWADAVSMLLLPPLFLHFTLVFPERPRQLGAQRRSADRCCRSLYLPALLLGAARVVGAAARAPSRRAVFSSVLDAARARSSCSTSPLCLVGGLGDHDARARPRALGHRAPPAALDRLGHGARRASRSRSATRCRSRSAFDAAARCELSRRCCSASCRSRSPRPSSATG